MNRLDQASAAPAQQAERPLHATHEPRNPLGFTFAASPWLTTAEAAVYARRPNRTAFRKWAARRGIVMVDGRVDRRDIDAALKGRR